MKSFLKKKKRESEEMALQITSMADIFTILLVFLLKSYATSASTVTPTPGMKIPVGSGQDLAFEALKIEVSEKAVQVEGKPVATLEAYKFDRTEIQSDTSSRSLNDSLAKERKRQMLIAEGGGDVKVDSKVLIVADERVPYVTLKSVLASAAVNGYTDFKLTVVKGD